jgi:hypothetical protein
MIHERNLRPILRLIDWDEQRRMFQQILEGRENAASVPKK